MYALHQLGPLFGLFCIKSNQPANESLKGITLTLDVGHTNPTITGQTRCVFHDS